MELINHTPVVARTYATDDPRSPRVPYSVGMIHAKATFELVSPNRTELVTQDPFPLLLADEPTPLGVLPRDIVARTERKLEVMVLGMARARGGAPTSRARVGLRIGALERSLNVYGDRTWVGQDRASDPLPFESMPLTYDRAFGGTAEVELDADTKLQVSSPLNRHGRGFDAEKLARLMVEAWGAPEGYPRLSYRRLLPNLEGPACPVLSANDEPEPYCWAPIPRDIGFASNHRRVQAAANGSGVAGITRALKEGQLSLEDRYYRAHPDLILDALPPGARVRLSGMSTDGDFDFELPQLRVFADYVLGTRSGARELVPQVLVLLPEQRRLYMVYRTGFSFLPEAGMERSFRLRLTPGWIEASPGPVTPSS